MKRILALASALLLVFALASTQVGPVAFAHAEPEDCTPAIDSTVDTVPTQVVCKTGQAMDPEKSELSVFNAAGEQVDLGDSAVDLNDPDRLTISVSLDTTKITDGIYTVKYATLSTEDNEEDEGEFHFTVKLAAAAETPTTAATPAAEATPTASETQAVEETPTTAATPTEAAATPAPTESTAATLPAAATTLPTTGGEVNLGLYALIAVAGLMLLSAGAFVLVRARR